jgi:hypothetical protein
MAARLLDEIVCQIEASIRGIAIERSAVRENEE